MLCVHVSNMMYPYLDTRIDTVHMYKNTIESSESFHKGIATWLLHDFYEAKCCCPGSALHPICHDLWGARKVQMSFEIRQRKMYSILSMCLFTSVQ